MSGISQPNLLCVVRAQREAAAAAGAGGGAGARRRAPARLGFGSQARALLWRANTQSRRHPAFMRAMLSRSLTMALVVGHLFGGLGDDQASVQNRVGALYFVLTNQIMSSSGSMRTFLVERGIAQHELRSGLYSLPAYFVARSLAESLWQLAGALLFGALTYFLVGLAPAAEPFALFLAVVALVTLCAESYVVLVGAVMPDERSAAAAGPLVLALFMVSGGLFVNVASVPPLFRVLNHVNMFSYGFAALLQNEMAGLRLRCEPHELVGPLPPKGVELVSGLLGGAWPAQRCPVERGEQVVERMRMGERSPAENVQALLAVLVVFRVAGYLALRRRFQRR